MNDFEQGLLTYFTAEQLAAIQRVKVGIAGAGGLGSNCAHALVRSGFKKIRIVDFDKVDASNLNRQFYFLQQVGWPKVDMLRDNLRQINPAVEIEAMPVKVEADQAARIFADCDVVVEAFDRAEYKKMIVEAYLGSGKLLVSASGLSGWGDSDRLQVRRIKKNFFLIGDLVSGVQPGRPPVSPCVAIAAAKEADVVLSYVLGGGRDE